jgi:hypothetical protein
MDLAIEMYEQIIKEHTLWINENMREIGVYKKIIEAYPDDLELKKNMEWLIAYNEWEIEYDYLREIKSAREQSDKLRDLQRGRSGNLILRDATKDTECQSTDVSN